MTFAVRYAAFLKRFLKVTKPISVIFDCSDGTVGLVLQPLFNKQKNIKPKLLNSRPDGNFPAHGPNPWAKGAMNQLSRAMQRARANLGVIFDADGDRVFFVDDQGRTLLADHAAIAMAANFKGSMLIDVRMGYALREWLTAHRRKIVESRVGHYFIKKTMRAKKIPFAAELSGHYYFKDFFYADSGIFAAIQMINFVSQLTTNNPSISLRAGIQLTTLSRWIDSLSKYHNSGEINFEVKDKEGMMKKIESRFKKRATKISKLDGLRMEFGKNGSPSTGSGHHAGAWWFLVRPSNTEDVLRLVLEAKSESVYRARLKQVKAMIAG